jgi:hypothetical protein
MNTRTAPDSAICCGFDEGVSCVRDHLARAVMFVRLSRFRLSRAICDVDLTSAPSPMPIQDCVVSLSAARFRALIEACSERNAQSFSDTTLIQTRASVRICRGSMPSCWR